MKKLLILLLLIPKLAFAVSYVTSSTGTAADGTMAAPQRPSTTVASLPTCNSGATGQMYVVTNALTPVALSVVASGGAVTVGVTCNGSSWIVQ